jgi:UDP-3-O-[3-hydroxymyristoyl] glucosamine N-acyltransferase
MVPSSLYRPAHVKSSAQPEALEELIAHATQQDIRPAGRNRDISRRLQGYRAEVHATAVVHPNAELGPSVLVGPYSVIGPGP